MAEFDESSLAVVNSWLDPKVLQTDGEAREALNLVIAADWFQVGHA